MDKSRLLSEIDLLLRSLPSLSDLRTHNIAATVWTGQLNAVLNEWKGSSSIFINHMLNSSNYGEPAPTQHAYSSIIALIHEAKYSLILASTVSQSHQFDNGSTFNYFDEVRQIIETAKSELFFVDPYLDADFCSKYFPFVDQKVSIKLLGKNANSIKKLVPAAKVFQQSRNSSVSVAETAHIHDRFIFIDRKYGYVSGSSFKDGAKNAPVLLSQIVDTFDATLQIYETIWDKSKIIPLT